MRTNLQIAEDPRERGIFPFVYVAEEAQLNWDRLEHHVGRSVRHAQGTITLEALQKAVFEGQVCVMGIERNEEILAVLLARMVEYETYRAGRIIALAGSHLKEMFQFVHIIEEWCVSQGGIELEGWCRPSMVRLLRRFGWVPKFTIVSYDLRRKLQ